MHEDLVLLKSHQQDRGFRDEVKSHRQVLRDSELTPNSSCFGGDVSCSGERQEDDDGDEWWKALQNHLINQG